MTGNRNVDMQLKQSKVLRHVKPPTEFRKTPFRIPPENAVTYGYRAGGPDKTGRVVRDAFVGGSAQTVAGVQRLKKLLLYKSKFGISSRDGY
jgi:hypothetical protein